MSDLRTPSPLRTRQGEALQERARRLPRQGPPHTLQQRAERLIEEETVGHFHEAVGVLLVEPETEAFWACAPVKISPVAVAEKGVARGESLHARPILVAPKRMAQHAVLFPNLAAVVHGQPLAPSAPVEPGASDIYPIWAGLEHRRDATLGEAFAGLGQRDADAVTGHGLAHEDHLAALASHAAPAPRQAINREFDQRSWPWPLVSVLPGFVPLPHAERPFSSPTCLFLFPFPSCFSLFPVPCPLKREDPRQHLASGGLCQRGGIFRWVTVLGGRPPWRSRLLDRISLGGIYSWLEPPEALLGSALADDSEGFASEVTLPLGRRA